MKAHSHPLRLGAACACVLALQLALPLALLLPGAVHAADTPDDIADLQALLSQPVYAASKFAQAAAAAPAAVTVLTAGDIRAHGWRTLAEVLNSVRGVYLRYDRYYSYIGVRGFGRPGDFSSRLLVLIDGMRVNDNIYDQAGVGREFPLDVGLIERVEFIPGPGSALYGSNAVLGVVNIVTRSAVSLRGGVATVEFGTDASRQISLTRGLELGDAQLVLAAKTEMRPGRDVQYAEYATPDSAGGLARNADRETDRKLYAKWLQGGLSAMALVSERHKRIPTGLFGTAFPSSRTSSNDHYGFLDVQWQRQLEGEQQVFLRTTLAQYEYHGRFDYGPVEGLQRLEQRGRWAGLEARWLHDGWRGHRVVLGLEAQRNLQKRQRSSFEGGTAGPDEAVEINGRSQRWGLFAMDEATLGTDWRVVLGARLDRQLNGRSALTPRLGLLWDAAPGLVLKLLEGRAFREPNDYESRYSDSALLANPALRKEKLRTTELAADWRVQPRLRLAASLYVYKVNELIEQAPQPDSGQLQYQNVGAADATGLELEADYVHASGWRLRSSFSAQRTRDASSHVQIDNSPTTLGKLNLTLPLPRWQGKLGLEWQHVGARRTLAGATLPSHALAHATLQLAPPGSPVSVSASLYNLFDKAHADPGGPELIQDAVAQDGRQWRLQLALQF